MEMKIFLWNVKVTFNTKPLSKCPHHCFNTQAIVSRLGNTNPQELRCFYLVILTTIQRRKRMHGGKNGCCSPLRDQGRSSGTPASRDRDRLRFKLSLEQCVFCFESFSDGNGRGEFSLPFAFNNRIITNFDSLTFNSFELLLF
uniref:(northern house mosquito) hypothetical protein n=1 Tax=Culex pipiens TaxID=7175 RepID=A0A8D8BXS5_CULPI